MIIDPYRFSGYTALNSAQLNHSSAYFNKTMGVPTDNLKWTLSFFMKRAATTQNSLMGAISGTGFLMVFPNSSTFQMLAAGVVVFETSTTFTNTAGFDHVCIQFDSANGTQADRMIVYKNQTRCSTSTTAVTSSYSPHFNKNGVDTRFCTSYAAGWFGVPDDFFNGIIAETAFVDGSLVAPTVFSDASFRPKDLSTGITWGANGFWHTYQNSGALGTDSSGNGNTWTATDVTQSSTVP